MPDTDFAALLDQAENLTEETLLNVPEDWMQGRAGYGGLVGALALKAMRARVPVERKVRSLLLAFVGPVGPGPFSIQTRTLRTGKSVTTAEARVIQEGAVCCTAVGSFGGDRASVVQLAPGEHPAMPGPDEAFELPYIEGMTPAFTRHFTYRWALGDLPFSGQGGRELGGWIQFRENTDCLSEEWLVALADAWPVPVLALLTEPAPISTLTWELGFVHLDRDTCTVNDWWSFHTTVESAERGYVHEQGAIWDPEGRLAAYSRQTSTVFA
jgi:acyl-CoA thioesterase